MSKSVVAWTLLLLTIGCATTSTKDIRPDHRAEWKKLYLEAQELLASEKSDDKLSACKKFLKLSLETEFPLKDLALLRSHQSCNKNTTQPIPENISNLYKDLVVDIKLAENESAENYYDKAKLETNTRKKETYLLKAKQFAEKETSPLAEAIDKSLKRNSPRFIENPERSDFLAVANDYRGRREFDKAISYYKKLFKDKQSNSDEKFQALKGIRQTYKIMEKKNDYVTATVEMANWAKKDFEKSKTLRNIQRYHEAHTTLARTVWTEGQPTQAQKILNELSRQLKERYPLDEIYFLLGRITEESGDLEKALEYYDASSQEKTTQANLADKVLWLKAWNYFKLKKFDKSAVAFVEMRDKVKDNSDKAKASFWLARSYASLNKTLEQKNELEQLAKNDPLGYYGLLSYRELNQPMPALTFNNISTPDVSKLSEADPKTRILLDWLINVNETVFAEKLLNQISDDFKARNITREEAWLTLSSGYASSGLYLPLFAFIGALKPEIKDQILADHPDLLFPTKYLNEIKEASAKSQVPASYILSIIRQESAFNPEARSTTDARGLMQLMPNVAKAIAKEKALTYSEADDLYEPKINLPLGAFELKKLTAKYKDKFILSTAAYNASGTAIQGWLNSRYRSDALEFIEEIPYEETRAYVKLVMRNYAFYERMLNQGKPTEFPEQLLKWEKSN